jgi:hypothetical protein
VIGPYNFKKIQFNTKLHFLFFFFLSFLGGEEKWSHWIWFRKRKLSLWMISATKMIDFYDKMIHIMEGGVKIRCFVP